MAADSEGSAARSADRYEKFVKVLLNAGADDSVWAEKVGQLFEIVPDSNPYDLKAGDVVKVKAFYKDTPIVASWMAVRDGDEEQQSTHAAAALLAVADGHFFIADQPGLWVAIARVQIEEEEGGGLHYLTAALEFEVKP